MQWVPIQREGKHPRAIAGRAKPVTVMVAASVFCAVWLTACGGGSTAPDVFTYQLVAATSPTSDDGSRIVADCTSQVAPLPPEPISGTFTVTAAMDQSADVTQFALSNIAFQSTSYVVAGESGTLSLRMGNHPQPLSMTLMVTINGQPVELAGTGSLDTFTGSPPRLSNVLLSGQAGMCAAAGVEEYSLTVFAVPEL